MRFLLDHNVLGSLRNLLQERGHDVVWSRDLVGQDAEDPIVAAAAMEHDRVLVSHDNDMKRVHKFISDAHRARFPNLSRLMLQCDQATSLDRVSLLLPLIELEFELALASGEQFMFTIQGTRAVICR